MCSMIRHSILGIPIGSRSHAITSCQDIIGTDGLPQYLVIALLIMTSFFSDHYSVSLLSHSEKGWEEKIAKEDGGLRSFSILNIPSILSQTELRLSLINHDWERSLLCASHHSICRLKRASQSSQWHVKTDQAWESLTWLVPTRLVIGQEISGSEVIGSLAWESGQCVRNSIYSQWTISLSFKRKFLSTTDKWLEGVNRYYVTQKVRSLMVFVT